MSFKQKAAEARRRVHSRRRALVLFAVQVLIILHIVHFYLTGSTVGPLEPSESAAFIRSKEINPGLIFFSGAILFTLIFGRFFCGWGCHILALQDASAWLLKKMHIRARPIRSRALLVVPVLAFFWMFVVPFFGRANDSEIHTKWLTNNFWETFPGPFVSILTLFIAGGYVVFLLGNKAYCRYACPYGAAFGAADSLAVGKITVDNSLCEGCMQCTKNCSSGVLVHDEIKKHGVVVDSNCMKTLDCVAGCPQQALKFEFSAPSIFQPSSGNSSLYPLSWKKEITLILGFLAGFLATYDLFGEIPFLLALGLGLITAYGLYHFIYRRVKLFNSVFKSIFVTFAFLLFFHAASVRFCEFNRDSAFDSTFSARMNYLRGDSFMGGIVESESFSKAKKWATIAQSFSYAGEARNSYVLAWSELAEGNVEQFVKLLERVVELRPKFGEIMFQLGLHYLRVEDVKQAQNWLEAIPFNDSRYKDAQDFLEPLKNSNQ